MHMKPTIIYHLLLLYCIYHDCELSLIVGFMCIRGVIYYPNELLPGITYTSVWLLRD